MESKGRDLGWVTWWALLGLYIACAVMQWWAAAVPLAGLVGFGLLFLGFRAYIRWRGRQLRRGW